MSWRKPIYMTKLRIRSPEILKSLAEYEKTQWYFPEQIKEYQHRQLEKLLKHASEHVPYYRQIMQECGALQNGSIDLDRFTDIPFLTKDVLRERFEELKSDDLQQRNWYENASGGSTGEPVVLIQDREFSDRSRARTIIGSRMAGIELCDPEIILWGSTRDLFQEAEGLRAKLDKFIRNQTLLNAFKMSHGNMTEYIKLINSMHPKLILAYAQSAYELARFSLDQSLPIEGVGAVVTSAGTLYPFMRETISQAFHAPVFNRYGSREVGGIATECDAHLGMHVHMETQLIEIINAQGNRCKSGEEGEIVVTSLTNYAMPLIRYRIGDMGVWSELECTCGRGARLLKAVTGRVTDYFISRDGKIVPSEYFIHLLGVVLNSGWVKKTQIIQEDYDHIRIKFVSYARPVRRNLEDIIHKIRLVMGQSCIVDIDFVDDIPPLKSGKYRYTISKIHGMSKKSQRNDLSIGNPVSGDALCF